VQKTTSGCIHQETKKKQKNKANERKGEKNFHQTTQKFEPHHSSNKPEKKVEIQNENNLANELEQKPTQQRNSQTQISLGFLM